MNSLSIVRPNGLITRDNSPRNLEFPFQALDKLVTPNASFYVRSHFSPPRIDADQYQLKVFGQVNSTLELSFQELKALPNETVTMTMECAGNSRVWLHPKVRGVAWELGAVSTAEWTGVPLKVVLEKAGLKPDALEVIFVGGDKGVMEDPMPSPGEIDYSRSLPLEKCLDDVLIAFEMNGEPLTLEHGFPVRAIVPNYYGMASVKWLTGLQVVDKPFMGYFQTVDYAYWKQEGDKAPEMVPLSTMLVKSQIARPAPHEQVTAGSSYEVYGAAWTGEGEISTVEISTDGGQIWAKAELLDVPQNGVWQRWRYVWQVPQQQGEVQLVARATDSTGQIQPTTHDPGRMNYMINKQLHIPVHIQ